MVHVPDVECSHFAVAVATRPEDLLRGCHCAGCGGTDIRLTGASVQRGFVGRDGRYQALSVPLARCASCGRRERVLPCDAVPGKVHSVELIFDAVIAVEVHKRGESEVARSFSLSRQLISSWRRGVRCAREE